MSWYLNLYMNSLTIFPIYSACKDDCLLCQTISSLHIDWSSSFVFKMKGVKRPTGSNSGTNRIEYFMLCWWRIYYFAWEAEIAISYIPVYSSSLLNISTIYIECYCQLTDILSRQVIHYFFHITLKFCQVEFTNLH